MAQINLGKVVGDSAYQVAVNNGFIGTEEEWLASLKGNTGATGPMGPQGPKGDKGDTGPQGPAGTYTAGDGISIDNNVISATGGDYYAGNGISIDEDRNINIETDGDTISFNGNNQIYGVLPACTTDVDGTYVLQAVVFNAALVGYSWVSLPSAEGVSF